MGRSRIGATVMTPAERQRRRRAKLARKQIDIRTFAYHVA